MVSGLPFGISAPTGISGSLPAIPAAQPSVLPELPAAGIPVNQAPASPDGNPPGLAKLLILGTNLLNTMAQVLQSLLGTGGPQPSPGANPFQGLLPAQPSPGALGTPLPFGVGAIQQLPVGQPFFQPQLAQPQFSFFPAAPVQTQTPAPAPLSFSPTNPLQAQTPATPGGSTGDVGLDIQRMTQDPTLQQTLATLARDPQGSALIQAAARNNFRIATGQRGAANQGLTTWDSTMQNNLITVPQANMYKLLAHELYHAATLRLDPGVEKDADAIGEAIGTRLGVDRNTILQSG